MGLAGLKNKNKSAKVQKYVQNLEAQAKGAGISKKDLHDQDEARARRAELKKQQEMEEKEANALFKPVLKPLGGSSDDPKSRVCAFFAQGPVANPFLFVLIVAHICVQANAFVAPSANSHMICLC